MNRQSLMPLLMVMLLMGAGTAHILQAQTTPSATASTATATATASQMVELNTQRILDALNTRHAEFANNHEALRTFISNELNAIFDRTYSARMVLGRHARGADERDIALFAEALTDGLLQRYGTLLLDADTQLRIRIKSEAPLPRGVGVRVSSEILRQGEASIALDYLLHQSDGQWKIFDVIVEGVSMVQTFRLQFDGQLQHKSIREVANELRAGQIQAAG